MTSTSHQDADSRAIEEKDWGYLFRPRALDVVWGNERKYWHIPSDPRDDSPALLVCVMCFQVTASVTLKPGKRYRISFSLGFEPDASGWNQHPVFLMAKVGKSGRHSWKRLKQVEQLPRGPVDVPDDADPFEIEVPSVPDTTLYFGIHEIWSCSWKDGLRIYSASVKEVKTGDRANG